MKDKIIAKQKELIELMDRYFLSSKKPSLDELIEYGDLKSELQAIESQEVEEVSAEEILAKLAHEQWSGWMKYLFSKGEYKEGLWIMPKWAVGRWTKQMNSSYNKLSENEKESDREEARKFIKVFQEYANQFLKMTDEMIRNKSLEIVGFNVLKRNREIEMEKSIKAVRKSVHEEQESKEQETAEEILNKVHNIERMSACMEDSYVLKRTAIKAMQEYAQQSSKATDDMIEKFMKSVIALHLTFQMDDSKQEECYLAYHDLKRHIEII